MRFLSVILIAGILFLSSFGGMVRPVQKKTDDCCKKQAKMSCTHKPAENKSSDDNCGQPGCTMMFMCSICGFVVEQCATVLPLHASVISKPVARYVSSYLAGYTPDSWKPPKTC
jgi:hypothetical protein